MWSMITIYILSIPNILWKLKLFVINDIKYFLNIFEDIRDTEFSYVHPKFVTFGLNVCIALKKKKCVSCFL